MDTPETDIDLAVRAAAADPDNDQLRLALHARVASAELYIVLEEEPTGESIRPMILETSDARLVLAFDLEERMSAFMGRITPYAALSGRRIAAMLAGSGIGLALNIDSPDETVLPGTAMNWMSETLGNLSQMRESRIKEVTRPGALPEELLHTLDQRLGAMAGLARAAWLSGVTYEDGALGHLMAITGAPEAAQPAITEAIGEALRLSGLEAGELDIGYFEPGAPIVEALDRVALRFDLPDLMDPKATTHAAPGSDPAKPPKLI